ncbi:hypothetical protein [Corynebacterium sp. sy039]|uniref:DUF7507 domain-containing protein n=1 Tax=Corynebacterium sp. sy039 TaxID=2599641 RepID=UPI0011B3BDCC|nr:hypothetical protein [Corynebacterium sp. sy039]QDZ41936.1 hypothetical protein FQV43_01195 [Corynebacterium sp. sy039]
MGKKHWLLRRVGAVMMTTGLLSSGIWGGAGSGLSAPVVWAQEETTAPAADTARPKQLPGKPGEPGSAIKSLTVTADPDNKDKVVLNVDFAFPDDAKPGDYVDIDISRKIEGGLSLSGGIFPLGDDNRLIDPEIGKAIAVIKNSPHGYRVALLPEADGLVNRTAKFKRTTQIPQAQCGRDPASVKYTATTIDSQGNKHVWDLHTTVERDAGECETNTNPDPRGTVVGMPIPVMKCSAYMSSLKYSTGDSVYNQGAGVYGTANGDVYVTPPIGDAGAANETFQDIYVRVRVDEAQTPMKMWKIREGLGNLKLELNGESARDGVASSHPGFANANGGWKPGDIATKYPEGTPVPPQAYVYPPDFDVAGVKAKAQPGTNGLSESFDWNSKTITQEDATALGKLFAEAFKAWQEAHKPEVIGSNTDPANGTVYVDYKIPGLYKPVIMQNAWGEEVTSLETKITLSKRFLDENGNVREDAAKSWLEDSKLYRIGNLGSGVFAPYSGAAKYNTIVTYSTDPESFKSGQGHTGTGAHYGSCGEGKATPFAAQEGIAAGDPLPSKPDVTPTSSVTPSTSSSAPSTTSSSAAPSTTSSSVTPSSTTSSTPSTTSSSSVEPTPSTSSSVVPTSSSSVPVVPVEPVKIPGVRVVKLINGDDANREPGVAVKPGESLNISFEVSNTGETPLKDVTVSDDQIKNAQDIVCENKPDVLAPGESFTCTATLPAPSSGVTHKDTATVTGVPVDEEGHPVGDTPVTDDDSAFAWLDEPAKVAKIPSIKVIKKIDGDDANVAPGVRVAPGADMKVSFEVTNDGSAALENINLTDNVIPAKDITCANKPETLNPGESFTCSATLKAPVSGDHVNIATVEGTPVYGDGEFGPTSPVLDVDPARAWVDEPVKVAKVPSVKVIKSINGDDANAYPGVGVAPGSDMSISFEVTNDGDVALENINLTDNVIPADHITCANKPESLKPGQSFTCSATLKAPVSGKHVNIAAVEGTPVYGEGESGPTSPVSDVDPARAWVDEPASVVKTPAISVIKKINGDDANVYPGVKVGPGSDMDIVFEVTNTGSATLEKIDLTDNVIPAKDITCENKPESLKPGQSFTCSATLKAPATGEHVNIATAQATPVYGEGESGPTSPVSDDDPARAWVDEPQKEVKKPSITVVKKINDEDANTKPGVKVQPGEDMDIVFEVTNTGSATLDNITLSDNVIPADQITCADKPETLKPGESFTCHATLAAPASGDHVNIATVEGTPVYGEGETGPDSPVRDSDEANAWVDEPQKEVKKPSITVVKKINDDDANSKPGVKVQPGEDMNIVFEVTNTGTATLGDITVSDNVIPADQITCENKPETLNPGQSFTCHATLKAPSTGDHVNIATVEGTPVYADGETGSDGPVKDVDEANAWVDVPDAPVMNPSITVVKKINDEDANAKPGVKVQPGEDMSIVFEVSNDGDVALEDVALSDNVVDAKDIMCEDKPDTLNPGESFTCSATLKAPLSGDHVNIATVEGTPVYGEGESGPTDPVMDSDVARAWVDEPEKVVKVPSITVVKKINGDDANSKPGVKVQPGEDMNIVFEVTNTGSAVLEDIDLADNVIPSDQITCEDKPESLKPGESFTCHATLKAPSSGDHVNIATAQATPVYGDGETGSDQPVLDVDVARAVVVEPDQPEQPEQPEEGKPSKPAKPAKPSKPEADKPAGSCGESVGVKPACGTPSEPESSKPGSEPGQSGGVIAGEVVKHCQKPTNPGDSPAQSGTNPAESGDPVKAQTGGSTKATAKAGAKTNTGGKTQKSGARVTTGGHLAA